MKVTAGFVPVAPYRTTSNCTCAKFTSQLATLEPPPPAMQALFVALRGNQDATNAFLSAIAGAFHCPISCPMKTSAASWPPRCERSVSCT
jgi:hypothetical protein